MTPTDQLDQRLHVGPYRAPGRSARLLSRISWSGVAAAISLAVPGHARAQAPPPSFADIVLAGFHTAYHATQRTTVINHGHQSWFEAAVVQNENGTRSVRVTAPPRRAGEMEVDDGSYRWRYQPIRRIVSINPSTAAHHQRRERSQQATMTSAGTDVVAGRPATIYDVRPPRPDSPALRVWVDNATSIALRTDWVTRDGRRISQAFTQIRFGVGGGVRFLWPAGAQLQVRPWPDAMPRKPLVVVDTPVALPNRLPPGVLFDGVWLREIAGRQVLWFHFHQRRLDASLFETLEGPDHPAPPAAGVENWQLGPLNITLVGRLPAPVQARLRSSIRLLQR